MMEEEKEMNLDPHAHSQKQSRVGPMKSGHEFTGSSLYFDFYVITFLSGFCRNKISVE